jgi:hypothetical protein
MVEDDTKTNQDCECKKCICKNETVERVELTLSEYNKIQIEWMNVHKYYLSQKAGYDVGFNETAKSWVDCGLAIMFRNRFKIKQK